MLDHVMDEGKRLAVIGVDATRHRFCSEESVL